MKNVALVLLVLSSGCSRYQLGQVPDANETGGGSGGGSVGGGSGAGGGSGGGGGGAADAGPKDAGPTDAGLTDAGPPWDAGQTVFTPVSNLGCIPGLVGDGGILVAGGAIVDPPGSYEYATCGSNADCGCPFSCQADPVFGPGLMFCLWPCATSADCADPTTFCQAGVCKTRQCASDGGTLWNACDADGHDDGICQLTFGFNGNDAFGICELTGSVPVGSPCLPPSPQCSLDDNCPPGELRRDAGPGAFCVPGAICNLNHAGDLALNDAGVAVFSSTFTCQRVCDPASPVSQCPANEQCIATPSLAYPHNGVCTQVGPNGCFTATQDDRTLFVACANSSDCACDQRCVRDFEALPNSGIPAVDGGMLICAIACQSNADCFDPTTHCVNGGCLPNAPAICTNGVLAQSCDASGTGDGTCLGSIASGSTECVQSGAAGLNQPCQPFVPSRGEPSKLCAAGLTCAGLLDGGAECRPVCTSGTVATRAECPTGQLCEKVFLDSYAPSAIWSAVSLGACYVESAPGCVEGYSLGGLGAGCFANNNCACPYQCDAGFDLIGQPTTFCQ